MCITESLCTPETNKTLLINYVLTLKKKTFFNAEKKMLPMN